MRRNGHFGGIFARHSDQGRTGYDVVAYVEFNDGLNGSDRGNVPVGQTVTRQA